MNNTINKIKLFFKSKPITIIIALLVIAAIMTGVAFGVIALIKATSDPCANQIGKVWNNDLKKCVLSKCPNNGNLCLIKDVPKSGNCTADDYCSTYEGVEYIYDPSSCECTIKCSNSEEEPFAKNGNSYTKFTNGKPDNPLTCGVKCEYNTSTDINIPGGKKWCLPDYLCGQNLDEQNENLNPGVGCFSNEYYDSCSEPNPDNVVCLKSVNCVNTSKYGKRCEDKLCSGLEENTKEELVYACLTDDDCIRGGDTVDDNDGFKCIKPGMSSLKEDEKFKYFNSVGYCEKTNKLFDGNCTTKRLLGEKKNNDESPSIVNCFQDSKFNSNMKTITGFSTFNKQCGGDTNNACSADGLCKNNFQPLPIEGESGCFKGNNPKDMEKDLSYWCCNSKNRAVTPNNDKFCCPKKSLTVGNQQLCTLNTEYSYSKHQLDNTANISDTIHCSKNEDCTKLNDQFYKGLNINPSEGSNKENPKFSSLYCDSKSNTCKAWCGLYDGNNQIPDTFAKIDVENSTKDDSKNYSWCVLKDSKKCESNIWSWDNGVLNAGHPICKNDTGGTIGKKAFSSSMGEGYSTSGTVSFSDPSGKTCNVNASMCLDQFALNNFKFNNIGVDKANNKCKFNVACDQLKISTPDGVTTNPSYNWVDPINPNWAKNNTWFYENYKIGDYPINPDTSGLSPYYIPNSSGECKGLDSDFNKINNITTTPFSYDSNTDQCYFNDYSNIKLRQTGEYCEKGVSVKDNGCFNPTNDLKENFENSQIIFSAKQRAKDLTKADILSESDSTKYPCSSFNIKTDNKETKSNVINNIGNKFKIQCTDNDLGQGIITCLNNSNNPINCCSDVGSEYKIDFTYPNTYECSGGSANKCYEKSLKYPFKCELHMSDSSCTYAGTPNGESKCEASILDSYACDINGNNGFSFPDPTTFADNGIDFYVNILQTLKLALLIIGMPPYVWNNGGQTHSMSYLGGIVGDTNGCGWMNKDNSDCPRSNIFPNTSGDTVPSTTPKTIPSKYNYVTFVNNQQVQYYSPLFDGNAIIPVSYLYNDYSNPPPLTEGLKNPVYGKRNEDIIVKFILKKDKKGNYFYNIQNISNKLYISDDGNGHIISDSDENKATPFCFKNHGCGQILLSIIPSNILANLEKNRQYPKFNIPFYENTLSVNYQEWTKSNYTSKLSGLIIEPGGTKFSKNSLCPSSNPCGSSCDSEDYRQSKSSTINSFCLFR